MAQINLPTKTSNRAATMTALGNQIVDAEQLATYQSGKAIPPEITPISGNTETEALAKQQEEEQENAASLARKAQRDTQRRLRAIGLAVQRGWKNLKFRTEAVPMPGGVGVPLAILLILFMVLIPVNGHTRMTWLWYTIIGRAVIDPSYGQYISPPGGTNAAPQQTIIQNAPTTPGNFGSNLVPLSTTVSGSVGTGSVQNSGGYTSVITNYADIMSRVGD